VGHPQEEKAMAAFRPTYITFDCYGTLIDFQMSRMTRTLFADRLAPDSLPAFTTDFSAYRFDEVLGNWRPYADVIKTALRRARGCNRRTTYKVGFSAHRYKGCRDEGWYRR
jgi:2-haloacid dehalogenase